MSAIGGGAVRARRKQELERHLRRVLAEFDRVNPRPTDVDRLGPWLRARSRVERQARRDLKRSSGREGYLKRREILAEVAQGRTSWPTPKGTSGVGAQTSQIAPDPTKPEN